MIEICIFQALGLYWEYQRGLVVSSLFSDRKYSGKKGVNCESVFAISDSQTIPLVLMKLQSVIENRNWPSAIEL